jgi:hypothetical protein
VLNPVKDGKQLSVDASGNLLVTGSFSVSGGNAAASTTGVAVPAQADYVGFNSGGTLVGVSSTNALPIQAATYGTVVPGTAGTQSELMGAVAQVSTVPAATDGQQVAAQADAGGSLRINPFGNQGSFKTVVSSGAGNTTRTITVTSGKKWEFLGGNIAFAVANSGSARPIGFNFSDSAAKVIATVNAGVSAAINTTSNYTFGPGVPLSTGLTTGAAQIPCPSLALGPSFTFNCASSTGVAGDTITVVLNVIEYTD